MAKEGNIKKETNENKEIGMSKEKKGIEKAMDREQIRKEIEKLPDDERKQLMPALEGAGRMAEDLCGDLIAQLYKIGTLDCVIQLAEAVYNDAQLNRNHYQRIPLDLYRRINKFSRVGKEECWPDKETRATIYSSLLGPSEVGLTGDISHEFHNHCKNLRKAARSFSENPKVAPDHRPRLGVESAGTALKEYLLRLCGAGLEIGIENIQSIFDRAREVLLDPSIEAVFNSIPIKDNHWPTNGPKGSDLVDKISSAIEPQLDPNTAKILRKKFINLQQVAYFGSETIKLLFKKDWQDWKGSLPFLIDQAYQWENALERYHSN